MAKSNYVSLAHRIRKAGSEIAVDKANRIADKLYNYGLLTENQLSKIDELSVDRLVSLQRANPGAWNVQ